MSNKPISVVITWDKKESRYKTTGDWGCGHVFCGTGKTISESVGDFMIANREELNFQFVVKPKGETEFKASTFHGKARTKDMLSSVEKKALGLGE